MGVVLGSMLVWKDSHVGSISGVPEGGRIYFCSVPHTPCELCILAVKSGKNRTFFYTQKENTILL